MMSDRNFDFYITTDFVPKYWYLLEAVWWIAFQCIPYYPNNARHLLESDFYEKSVSNDIALSNSHLMALEKEYTDKAGISPNPMTVSGNPIHKNAIDEQIADYQDFLQSLKGKVEADYYKKVIYDLEEQKANRDLWLKEHKKKLSIHVASLFSLIWEGKIRTTGFKVFGRTTEEAKRRIRDNSLVIGQLPREVISPEEWSLEAMKWDDCILQCEHHLFAGVAIHHNDILNAFPPKCERIDGGLCDGLVISSERKKIKFIEEPEANNSKTGRPAKNWDAFYLELAKRIKSESLPEKQSAAAYEFRAWFHDALGESVGLSTISEKLKPFYREFF